jgi:hypothetical protein
MEKQLEVTGGHGITKGQMCFSKKQIESCQMMIFLADARHNLLNHRIDANYGSFSFSGGRWWHQSRTHDFGQTDWLSAKPYFPAWKVN